MPTHPDRSLDCSGCRHIVARADSLDDVSAVVHRRSGHRPPSSAAAPAPTPCTFYGCRLPAVEGSAPVLCEAHAAFVICPTCEFWPFTAWRNCDICRGARYVRPEAAQEAVMLWRRVESRERSEIPRSERDARWTRSPKWKVYGGWDDGPDEDPTPVLGRRRIPDAMLPEAWIGDDGGDS